jgi:hypothetical protein
MSLTIGFLILFFTIVIPGFLFLRFYYFGEFSKQFNPKENITKQLLFGLIPGSIIQLSCYLIAKKMGWINMTVVKLLTSFESINNQNVSADKVTQHALSNTTIFIAFTLCVYVVSVVLGISTSRIIRYFKWDKYYKILRFKNQWYYVFSGEIFEFRKFKAVANKLQKIDTSKNNVELTRADVLINNGGKSELYSGYVVDYDLNPLDNSRLDNLYLLDAYRYKISEIKNEGSNLAHPTVVEKKHIPGEVFILNMANMININVLYLLSPKTTNYTRRNIFFRFINSFVFFGFLPWTYAIFAKVESIEFQLYLHFHQYAWWLDKVLFSLAYFILLGMLTSSKNKVTNNYEYTKKEFVNNLLSLAMLLVIAFSVYFIF